MIPKFKVGDKIEWAGEDPVVILEVKRHIYVLGYADAPHIHETATIEVVDKHYRLVLNGVEHMLSLLA